MNFSRHRFKSIVIFTSVRWNLQFGLSYRDLEELLKERGVDVDHTSIYRWVRKFASKVKPELPKYRKYTGDSWKVKDEAIQVKDEQYYLYEAVDKNGHTLDFLLSKRKDKNKAERFFQKTIE